MKRNIIEQTEKYIRDANNEAGKYTKPVLNRYPLIFSFLVVFSFASILHGFDIWTGHIEIFERHPSLLVIIGTVTLFLTGTLYKTLQKVSTK